MAQKPKWVLHCTL